jgi:hypothetical protein
MGGTGSGRRPEHESPDMVMNDQHLALDVSASIKPSASAIKIDGTGGCTLTLDLDEMGLSPEVVTTLMAMRMRPLRMHLETADA